MWKCVRCSSCVLNAIVWFVGDVPCVVVGCVVCDVLFILCGVCACCFSLMCLGVVIVMYCVMVQNVCLCVLRVRVGVSLIVLVFGVGGLWFDVVWFVGVCVLLCMFVCGRV